MMRLTDYLKSRADGRSVTGAVIFASLLALIQAALLVPYFHAASGFKPLDLQFPLSRYALAIQLGAYDDGARAAYLPFLLVDTLLAAASAAALVLLWAWLFRRQPNRIFAFLERGGVILVPLYTLGCDIAENAAFARLVGGLSGEAYADTIRFAVAVHGVRGAFLDLQVILTVLLVILFARTAGNRPGPRQGETADNGG